MFTRTALKTVCGALLGLAVIVGPVATPSASSRLDRREHLTFSGPIGLPGVTLAGGRYTFEVANPETSADVIRVRSLKTDEVVFLGFTRRGERPTGMSESRSVMLGEAPKGTAAPVLGWYPIGDNSGHQFVYAKTAR